MKILLDIRFPIQALEGTRPLITPLRIDALYEDTVIFYNAK